MEMKREKKSANSVTESTYFDTECMWWWMCKQPHSAPEVGPCRGLVSKSVESYWSLIASASVFWLGLAISLHGQYSGKARPELEKQDRLELTDTPVYILCCF